MSLYEKRKEEKEEEDVHTHTAAFAEQHIQQHHPFVSLGSFTFDPFKSSFGTETSDLE